MLTKDRCISYLLFELSVNIKFWTHKDFYDILKYFPYSDISNIFY